MPAAKPTSQIPPQLLVLLGNACTEMDNLLGDERADWNDPRTQLIFQVFDRATTALAHFLK